MKIYIGIDNGVTGSIGVLDQDGNLFYFDKTPTKESVSYVKTKIRMRTRIDYPRLRTVLQLTQEGLNHPIKAFIERPMINNQYFFASISASASLEATIIALESLDIGYEYCDSKAWQKMLLPAGCTGPQLKIASRDVGVRMWPEVQGRHIDCDGLLIAEWARRMNL